MVRITSLDDLRQVIGHPELGSSPKFVLGGGSNLVLTGDVKPLVLKVELMGRQRVEELPKAFIVEAGAGENWHDFVAICPSGRGGVVETSYSWDGKTYVEKQSKEIPMEWKDGEYVPEDSSNSGQKAGVNGDQAR